MKRVVVFLALALAAVSMAFATGEAEGSTGPEGPVVIEVFQWGPRDVDPEDEVVAFLNQELDIDLQISRILAREYSQNLEVKIAAGDIPDLFRLRSDSPHIYQNLYRDDYLASISSYADSLELDALQDWFEEPGVADFAEDDGFFRIPSRVNPQGAVGNLLYREDWLAELGLDVPTTNDEFVEVLRAVAEAQPGGDNTVPLTGTGIAQLNGLTTGFTGAVGWELQGGEYVWVNTLPEYREGLRFINALYEEGLIDREYFTLNETQSRGKFVGGTAFLALPNGGTWDRHPQYQSLLQENEPGAVVGIMDPRPAGPAGIVYGGSYGLTSPWVVPKRDQQESTIERIVTLLNFVHTDEGTSVLLEGVEGIHYTMADGERTTTAAWERDIIPGLGHMFAMSTDYARGKYGINETVDESMQIATQYAVYDPVPDSFTGQAFLDNMPQINDVYQTWFTDFVTGTKDLDSDWDDYLNALNRVGLEEVTAEVNEYLD
jgi:putative aldouronate transport system substrate-binding protein